MSPAGRSQTPTAPTHVAVAPARRCAYQVLRRVFERGAYADRALHGQAKGLAPRDRALAMRLSFGAVQRAGTLDHVVQALAGRPPARLDAPVLAALRLGLYELLFLSGAPARAVVADNVELAKQAQGSGRGHGLVNAVLRRADAEGAELLAALDDATSEAAAVYHSHPAWLAQLWWEELGADEARALMAADNLPAELSLRANTLVGDADGLVAQLPVSSHRDATLAEALVIDEAFDAHGSPLWQAGAFMPQSRAAMIVSRALGASPGERVLDLCAAPGGKTTHMSALMGSTGEIVAVERHAGRAAALQATCSRMHALNVSVQVADAALTRPPGDLFDRVLVDPPCSGLGTLQSRPDLRWRVEPHTVSELVATQATILHAGAQALRPGGTLVYSTCTISPAENERQIATFLDDHADFHVDDLSCELSDYQHPRASAFLLSLPSRHHTAGFFIARLRRAG